MPTFKKLTSSVSTTPKSAAATAYSETQTKDMALFHQWKQTGSKRDLGVLIDQLSPLIYHEVHRASGSLPPSALAAEAKKWAVKAVETFDPSKGASLSTHVVNYLPKVRRLNYKFQNAVRLPENMQLKYHEYHKAHTDLTEQLNREPNPDELAHSLGWSKAHTIKFRDSLFSDLIESQSERPAEYTQFNEGAILMNHLREQLTSKELFMLDSAGTMPVKELCEKLGVNLNRYNYLHKKLRDKILAIKNDIGM